MPMTPEALQDALEALVDKTTLYAVIDALATVASLKADHLRENWQDVDAAENWNYGARLLASLAVKLEGI